MVVGRLREASVGVRREGVANGWRGVPLRYSVYGRGEPTIVCCNGLGVSTFFWKYIVEYFGAQHRLITWEYRGHYSSGSPEKMTSANFSMAANARDLAAVLDACRVQRAVVIGHSMGCQVLLEFWHLFPGRVAGLVPICGPYGKPIDSLFRIPQISHPLFAGLHSLATTYPREVEAVVRPLLRTRIPFELARLGLINAQLAAFNDMAPYFEHLSKMDMEVFFLMMGEMQKHDAGPYLHKIDVPVLVVGGEADLFTPLDLSKEMRDKIPGAELLILRMGSHTGLIEYPELLNLRLEKFLRERVKPFLASKRRRKHVASGRAG